MKSHSVLGLLALVALTAAPDAGAQQNPRSREQIGVRGKLVAVEYGRPALRGRDMLAQAPPGFLWRLGADRATTLETQAVLDVGGYVLPPGAYSLFARHLGEGAWELVVNRDAGQWGTQHDSRKDVAAAPLVLESGPYVEMLTVELRPVPSSSSDGDESVELTVAWGEHRLRATFQAR